MASSKALLWQVPLASAAVAFAYETTFKDPNLRPWFHQSNYPAVVLKRFAIKNQKFGDLVKRCDLSAKVAMGAGVTGFVIGALSWSRYGVGISRVGNALCAGLCLGSAGFVGGSEIMMPHTSMERREVSLAMCLFVLELQAGAGGNGSGSPYTAPTSTNLKDPEYVSLARRAHLAGNIQPTRSLPLTPTTAVTAPVETECLPCKKQQAETTAIKASDRGTA